MSDIVLYVFGAIVIAVWTAGIIAAAEWIIGRD
jgi:hypothetical protein